MGAANAVAPIIVNNAEVTNNFSAYSAHIKTITADDITDEEIAASAGISSDADAVQQSLIIDKNNVQYSAYKDEDGKIFVLKLVNNIWVAAADGDGIDGLPETVGDVAPLLDGSTGIAVDDPVHTRFSKTVLLTTGANGEIYLGYIDEVGGSDVTGQEAEGDNNLHIFELTTVDDFSSWQLLTTLKLGGENSFDGINVNVHDMELEVDSLGNIYAALNSYRPNAAPNSGRFYSGLTRVVKYTKNDNTWQTLGDAYTAVVMHAAANQRFFPSSLAISTNDDIYYAYVEYIGTIDGSNMSLRVVKFDETAGVWNEVGDAEQRHPIIMNDASTVVHRTTLTLDLAVSPSGKLFLAAAAWIKYLTVTTYDPFEVVDEGKEPIWKVAFPTNGGTRLDNLSQSSGGRNVRPPLNLNIVAGSNDLPYVAYAENGLVDSKSVVVLGIVDELNVDNEIVSNWTPLNIPLAEATTAESSGTSPEHINLVLGANDRPYLLYRDESGNDFSRSIRADITNSTEVIELSVTEEEFDAGKVSLEIPELGDPNLFANYTFSNDQFILDLGLDHVALFDDTDLTKGTLTLKQENDFSFGANINFPALSLKVFATDIATLDVSHAEPVLVKVSFQASTDPEVLAKRGFAFKAYLCGEDPTQCTINVNEGDPIIFEYIQSKINSHVLIGDELPEGVTLDITDITEDGVIDGVILDTVASFQGKPSFTTAPGLESGSGLNLSQTYNFSVTATPNEGSLINLTDIVATPVTIDMTINVTNTPINVEADYVVTINENDFLNIVPTTNVAAESFDLVWDESSSEVDSTLVGLDFSWLKFNRLTGALTGQSRFVHAGIYRGTIFASGFDEGEKDGDRLQFPVEIVVTNVPMSWAALSETTESYEENQEEELNDDNVAVQFFYIKEANSLPDFITLDLTTGQLTLEPDFEDESEEPYTFTVVAEGWDEGEIQESTKNIIINHRNAPPSLELVLSVETEGVFPVFIDILGPAFDVDEPGNLVSYDGEVFMVFEDDENYAQHDIPAFDDEGIREIDEEGNPAFEAPIPVENSEGDDIFVEHTHTGFGHLEVVSNGLIYTPSVDDPKVVSIFYVVKDNEGLYQEGEVAVRVNVIKDVSFEHSSSAGSMGSLLGLFAFMFVIRIYKRKA